MTWRELIWRLLLAYPLRPWARWRHRRCLRRIAALDRELFPPAPPNVSGLSLAHRAVLHKANLGRSAFSMEPGAVWAVESHNHVQILNNAIDLKGRVERDGVHGC